LQKRYLAISGADAQDQNGSSVEITHAIDERETPARPPVLVLLVANRLWQVPGQGQHQ
jgi:hypothetical protein